MRDSARLTTSGSLPMSLGTPDVGLLPVAGGTLLASQLGLVLIISLVVLVARGGELTGY